MSGFQAVGSHPGADDVVTSDSRAGSATGPAWLTSMVSLEGAASLLVFLALMSEGTVRAIRCNNSVTQSCVSLAEAAPVGVALLVVSVLRMYVAGFDSHQQLKICNIRQRRGRMLSEVFPQTTRLSWWPRVGMSN